MKNILFIPAFLFVLLFSIKPNRTDNTIILYIDSVTVSIEGFEYKYSNDVFQSIVVVFPCLENDKKEIISPQEAYNTYMSSDYNYGFGGEAGEDEFYIFYTYLLRQKTDNKKIEKRNRLTNLYRTINAFHGTLNNGGTFYGHQHIRIVAIAERNSIYGGEIHNSPNFSLHHNSYTKSLYHLMQSTISEEPEKEEELKSYIEQITQMTKEEYYLYYAVNFENTYYTQMNLY